MSEKKINPSENKLFDRVVSILEQYRTNTVRAINSHMVTAYWLIGREIVTEIQKGENRAEYGKQIIENLSIKLTKKYGKGFSVTSLQYYRKFYYVYSDCKYIPRPAGVEFKTEESTSISRPMGVELNNHQKGHPRGDESDHEFSPQLSWSHYRALMRVKKLIEEQLGDI